MARILVVDDDSHIREVVRFALEKAGHAIVEAEDGAKALELTQSDKFDLLVLDIVMPEIDGLEVCRSLQAEARVPIIFLSSRDDELDRVLGLELGADDYVTKPFSPRELVSRVKAVLRRISAASPSEPKPEQIRYGDLLLDPVQFRCTHEGTEIVFTVTEFALLKTLLSSPGRAWTRQQLVDHAYGQDHVVTERTVDSHIRRVRQKLKTVGIEPIETVFGLGYRCRELGKG